MIDEATTPVTAVEKSSTPDAAETAPQNGKPSSFRERIQRAEQKAVERFRAKFGITDSLLEDINSSGQLPYLSKIHSLENELANYRQREEKTKQENERQQTEATLLSEVKKITSRNFLPQADGLFLKDLDNRVSRSNDGLLVDGQPLETFLPKYMAGHAYLFEASRTSGAGSRAGVPVPEKRAPTLEEVLLGNADGGFSERDKLKALRGLK